MSPKNSILVYSSCAMLIAALVLSGSTSSSAVAQHSGGKRFDCRLFCKMTGYHGMIGGCRCSFTLFTAKRSYPVWHKRSMAEHRLNDGISSRNRILPSTGTTPTYYRIKSHLNKTKWLNNEAEELNTMPPSGHLTSSYADYPDAKR